MKLVLNYLTKNRCYTNPTKIKPTKLVLHSLGVAQPKCDGVINNWNTVTASVSVHAFVEADRIVQTLPWDYRAWHVGSGKNGTYNTCAIGVEICEPKGHTYNGGTMIGYDIEMNKNYFEKVYNNAVDLFAHLCLTYDLSPTKDILCHSEVYQLGYGSNHADVMHWFPKHGKTMDGFRNDVRNRMITPTKTITKESSKEDVKWLQTRLNEKLEGLYALLKIDGIYDNKTRIAVLILCESLGWNKDGVDDGWKVGVKTINKIK